MDVICATRLGFTLLTMKYDVIIVGGGMVGLTLACALAQQTVLSIAILEAHPFTETRNANQPPLAYHHRVSAIALSSQRLLQALDVWDTIQSTRVSPFTQIQVRDAAGQGEIQFNSEEIAESVLGYIVENNVMQAALLEKIKQYPQITYVAPVTLTDFHVTEHHVKLTSEDERIFTAKLAVAADGAHSWLRQCAGIDLDKHDYEQKAIVATVHTSLPHQKIARQAFLATGPLAFLPLTPGDLSSIVWTLPTEEAKRLMALDVADFKQELANASSHCLGDIIDVQQRHALPLYRQQAKHYVQARLALIGDAAHTIHPLAGQGVNMGLLDAASLAEVVADASKQQRNFANIATLRRYERWRRADNFPMQAGVDVIHQLFTTDKSFLQRLRSFGLLQANEISWIKKLFTRHAVGDRSGLPLLAR